VLELVAPVEFQLLGPFEMIVEVERRSLGSPGEKAVLALMLLAAGRVVPRETLIDALWGEALALWRVRLWWISRPSHGQRRR
jgi:hypothetical protein